MMGTCGRLVPLWKGRRGLKAMPCCKGWMLYVTNELSSLNTISYPRIEGHRHRCSKNKTSLSKDVARNLFNSACKKCNTPITPSAYPALSSFGSRLGIVEKSIKITSLCEGPMELKHKTICLKSPSSPAAGPGRGGVSCSSFY